MGVVMSGAPENREPSSIPTSIVEAMILGPGSFPGFEMNVKVHLGVPDQFSGVPIPDGASLVGSVEREINHQNTLEIVFYSDLEPTQVVAYYTEKLAPAGYLPMENSNMPRMPIPFAQTGDDKFARVIFCAGESEPAWTVSSAPSGPSTRTHLRIDPDPERTPCGRRHRVPRESSEWEDSLPKLPIPPGLTLSMHGSSSTESTFNTSASLAGESSVANLIEGFVASMTPQGYEVNYSEIGTQFGLLQWTSADQKWVGQVVVTEDRRQANPSFELTSGATRSNVRSHSGGTTSQPFSIRFLGN